VCDVGPLQPVVTFTIQTKHTNQRFSKGSISDSFRKTSFNICAFCVTFATLMFAAIFWKSENADVHVSRTHHPAFTNIYFPDFGILAP
jgi:hypothetical protein